jgi:hypothetical protein
MKSAYKTTIELFSDVPKSSFGDLIGSIQIVTKKKSDHHSACKRNVPLNHFTKWPRARGHLVKWLRGTFLLKRVDSGSTLGRHSHTQTNALPRCSPRCHYFEAPSARAPTRTPSTSCRGAHHAVCCTAHLRSSLSPVFRAQGMLLPPTSAGSPLRFSRAPWFTRFRSRGTRFRTRDPLKRNVPPSHFTKWPGAATW